MGQHLYWTFAFNIIVNSVLTFFTMILLIECIMLLLRIKQPRVKAISRTLPFFKICIDFFFYNFSDWALLQGVNPLLAEKGTRQMSIMVNPFTGIQFCLQDGTPFSLADTIALSVNPLWIQVIVSTAMVGSITWCAFLLIQIFYEKKRISQLVKDSRKIEFKNLNISLTSWMVKKQVSIAASYRITSPCIAGKIILFPDPLIDELSNEEIDAIIAHEMAHFHWKDSSLRLFRSFVASIFWWIPTRGWQRRIEEMQEQASDAMIHQFGISQLALAEAVLKTAQKEKETSSLLLFSFAGQQFSLKNRIDKIFQKPQKSGSFIQYGLLIGCLLSVLLGKLWIF